MSLQDASLPVRRGVRRGTTRARRAALGLFLALVPAPSLALAAPAAPVAPGALGTSVQDERVIGPEERAEIALMLRRGEGDEAREVLEEILAEDPGDALSRGLLARCLFHDCEYERALEEGRAALDAIAGSERAGDAEALATLARTVAELELELGLVAEARASLARAGDALRPGADARDAWILGRARLAAGERAAAFEVWRAGAESRGPRTWDVLLDQARCQRALGRIESAASTLVAADRAAAQGLGSEPDVLVELGDVYFEAYGEVEDAVSLAHSPAQLYREALGLHPTHEGARLGLFELGRFNWLRQRTPPEEYLTAVFEERPRSIRGLLARGSTTLDDGDLKRARRALDRLEAIAPGRRDVRAEHAALAWVEHDRERARAILDELAEVDPGDGVPERIVGAHLIALYRFAEALPFLRSAVERDPRDWNTWRDLGRALANTGDEDGAREALARAVEVAEGRRDAWRDNMALVLERMAESMVEHESTTLRFAWQPDAAEILETYLVPFYEGAREELAARYGYTPGPTKIEVFRKWEDFSVRSTGFEGFPALGVCFGPVVTAVSPLSQMRGSFSWARTSYHEFTHVIHLGLSHNRCPRWITEGLATWEEGRKNPAWWRNMRRELLDARANGDIVPVRDLNRTFRGPRILFAYYQSGLLCKMLVEEHGFPPMVRLLEAFDRGLDLDQAFLEVFDRTPEQIDEAFAAFVDRHLAGLEIEPRWSPETTFRLRFELSRRPPADDPEAWAERWCTVAWGFYWQGKELDAEEALRLAATAGELPARGLFLRAELALKRNDLEAARTLYERGFEKGGEDFRARVALGSLLAQADDEEGALAAFHAAEDAFPGFDEPHLSAEVRLAALYEDGGDVEQAMEARMRWLSFNAGDFTIRVEVARWLSDQGRHAEAERYWREANEVDPFRRKMHRRWGMDLRALGRHEEALREFDVALAVPAELDPAAQEDAAGWAALEPELHGLRALTLLDLGRPDEARTAAETALASDEDCEPAREALDRLERE